MHLRPVEWLLIGYFGYLAAISWFVPLSRARRMRACVRSAAAACIVPLVAVADQSAPTQLAPLRDWAPVLYVLVSYWLPSLLVAGVDHRAELALLAFDRRWAASLSRTLARVPDWVVEVLELAYLFCYPMLPAAFAIIYLRGDGAEADRFWVAVVSAAVLSYGLLPWVRTRSPRHLLGPPPGRFYVRSLNEAILHRASVGLNTFPSGHVATAVATALAVTADLPAAGAGFLLLAAAIAVACIAGRYHYAADVLAGAATGVLAFAISRFA